MKLIQVFLLVAAIAAGTASAQECPPEGVVFFPHPDCTKYIICDNGHGVEMDCPPGLYYNPTIEQCDFTDNVPECIGGTRPPVGGSTTTNTPTTPPASPEPPTTPEPTDEPTTTQGPVPTTTANPSPGILTRCGDTITRNSGQILYKLNETYANNELCSFIIHVPNFSGILFTLNSHGFNSTATNPINIFTFSAAGLQESAHLGPPNPLNQVFVSGSLAVVIFKAETSGIGAKGFDLSFEGLGNPASLIGHQHVFNVTRDGEGEVLVPTQSADLARGTLNAYVMTQDHLVVAPSYYNLRLRISNARLLTCGDVMQCECDSIRVFTFSSERVNEEELFCDERYHRTSFTTRGLFIVVVNVFEDEYPRNATLSWLSEGL